MINVTIIFRNCQFPLFRWRFLALHPMEYVRNPGSHDALRTIASTSYLRRIIVKASVLRIKYHMFHNSKSK